MSSRIGSNQAVTCSILEMDKLDANNRLYAYYMEVGEEEVKTRSRYIRKIGVGSGNLDWDDFKEQVDSLRTSLNQL